ncbi:MAG: hypothetical protein DLM73_01030 [Chthoniobacterales bacterium]|nr:MAG: hypothetical protein DLM73_01030 [Chthoniobacterales bacterium]
MNSIRLKITIDLNRNHVLSYADLKALKPFVERGVAASLPDSVAVDTIKVTSIKETSTRNPSASAEQTLNPKAAAQ